MSTIDKDSSQSKDHNEEAVSEVAKAVSSRRTISIGPLYSFFECNGNYIIQFGSTSENGILHDIDKRTTMLHNKYIKSGTPYFNNKELACGGWALRALGIIDDKSLDATICERKRENKGLNNIILIEKLNPYFNGKLEKKTIREDIESLLEKMDPGHATIIYARYNSETKKKAKDAGINADSHIILLIIDNNKIKGVVLASGEKIYAEAVVLTTGTFLRGVIHIGKEQTKAGRVGEEASYGISNCLQKYQFKLR